MNTKRSPFGSSGWQTATLYTILLFHVLPLYAHDTSSFLNAVAAQRDSEEDASPLFNATRLNFTSASKGVADESALHGEATPIPRVLVRKPREGEEPGSAEVEQMAAVGGMGAGLPTRSGARAHGTAQLDFKEEDSEAPHWQREVLQADGSVVALDQQPADFASSQHPAHDLSHPGDGQVINVGFYDQGHQINTPPPRPPLELQGRDPTSWTLSDFYDYLSLDYSTTEAHSDDDQPTPIYMENENVSPDRRLFTPDHSPSGPTQDATACLPGFEHRNGTCQSLCHCHSSYCFNGGQCYTTTAGAFCRCNLQNYTWTKGTRCESVITDFQVMCFVVGGASVTVLLLFMLIVVFSKRLHLLKTENRRLRKRSSRSRPQSEQHNDTFSLSTAAEGSQANVRNPCGSPPSSPYAVAFYDNIICQKTLTQYTWEYEQRGEVCSEDDASKQEEPVQSSIKEDEALNIQNLLIPKQEESKASCEDAQEGCATIDLELLLPKEAETPPEPNPPLHCNVIPFNLPKSPQKSPMLRRPPGKSGQGRPLSQVYPRRGSEAGHSPTTSRSLPSLPSLPSRMDSPCLGEPSTP